MYISFNFLYCLYDIVLLYEFINICLIFMIIIDLLKNKCCKLKMSIDFLLKFKIECLQVYYLMYFMSIKCVFVEYIFYVCSVFFYVDRCMFNDGGQFVCM